MKDWLLQKGLTTVLAGLVREYGSVRNLTLNTADRWCELELDLNGESQPVRLRAEAVSFRTEGASTWVRIGRLNTSRPWLTQLALKFAVERDFELPPAAATAVRALL